MIAFVTVTIILIIIDVLGYINKTLESIAFNQSRYRHIPFIWLFY